MNGLQAVSSGKMSQAQMAARIAELEAQNAALQAKKKAPFTTKVSTKGAVSVYGLGRFPVTLYASQFETLLGKRDEILAFINSNRDKLAKKEGE